MAFTISYGETKSSGCDRFNRMSQMRGFLMAFFSFVVVCGCERSGSEKEVRISDSETEVALADVSCPKRSGGPSLQDLERTFCEIGTNGVPLGGGFLMSHKICGMRRYYVVSADHVFRAISKTGESLWFAFPGTNNAHCVDIDIPKKVPWFFTLVREKDISDIAAFDVCGSEGQLAAAGAAFIDFSPNDDGSVAQFCLEGVRMLQTAEFECNGVVLGSRVYAFANSCELWNLLCDKRASSMMVVESCISKMPGQPIRSPVLNVSGSKRIQFTMIDAMMLNGNSGGPVFAIDESGRYVAIGVLSARMPPVHETPLTAVLPHPGTFVTPFDGLETRFTEMHVAKRLGNAGKAN